MSDLSVVAGARSGIRTWLGVFGVLSVIAGIIILANPVGTGTTAAFIVTLIAGIYSIVAGIAYAFSGLFGNGLTFWSRLLRIVLGVLLTAAGFVVAFNASSAKAGFIWFFVIMIGVTWIAEGFMTFANLGVAGSKAGAVVFAIISIIAGIVMIISPVMGALAVWITIGILLIVSGITWVVAAFVSGR